MVNDAKTSFYDAEHRCVGPYNGCSCGQTREVEVVYNDYQPNGSLRRTTMEAHTTGLSLSTCFWHVFPPPAGALSITRVSGEFLPVEDFNALILLRDGDTIITHPKGSFVRPTYFNGGFR